LPHPLNSARERLKRANENIRDLDSEISIFLAPFPLIPWKGADPVFTDADQKAFDVLREHAKSGVGLSRFSVLASEIVHHLRCAFDHVIWELSTPDARKRFGSGIYFPVEKSSPECILKPTGKVKHSSYCRKIKGITSLTGMERIDALQPYKRVDPQNSPLMLIHDLDRFAKHRELSVVIPNVGMHIRGREFQRFRMVKDSASGGLRVLGPAGPPKMDVHGELSAQVAFAEVIERKGEPLVKFLSDLAHFASDAVESFANEFP
jgi:hypothetical protein